MSEASRLTIKDNNWYIHDFLKAVGSNIRASSPINATIIAYFWYFNNNVFSVILPLAFDNDNVSLIQISRLHTWVLFAILFSMRRSQKWVFISKFVLKIN